MEWNERIAQAEWENRQPRRRLRGWRRAAAWGAVSSVLLVGGWAVWPEPPPSFEERVGALCEGLLPVEQARKVAGDPEKFVAEDFSVGKESESDDAYGLRCTFPGATVRIVRLNTGSSLWRGPESELPSLTIRLPRVYEIPEPLGGGWQGYYDGWKTVVNLTCKDREHSITVYAEASDESEATRVELANLVAGTARRSADRWDCDTAFGRRITRVTAPHDDPQPVAEADGTCAGLRLEGTRVRFVREAEDARTPSPMELCELYRAPYDGLPKETRLYTMRAYFGAFAGKNRSSIADWHVPSRHENDAGYFEGRSADRPAGAWASAECGSSADPALFTIVPEDSEAAPRFLREVLTAFAERSARRHGCTNLTLPEGAPGR